MGKENTVRNGHANDGVHSSFAQNKGLRKGPKEQITKNCIRAGAPESCQPCQGQIPQATLLARADYSVVRNDVFLARDMMSFWEECRIQLGVIWYHILVYSIPPVVSTLWRYIFSFYQPTN